MSTTNKYIVTWDALQMHVRVLARRIYENKEPFSKIIAVTRGGLIPAAMLARELGIRYIDTVCISSYDHDHQRDLRIFKQAEGNGENTLLVEDLVDTGETAKVLRDIYPKAYFVSVFAKPKAKNLINDYVLEIGQDVWIEQPWDMEVNFVPPICGKD